MKKEKVTTETVLPKLELSLNHVLITTKKSTVSKLITSLEAENRDAALLHVQEVLAVGPFVKKENGLVINVGDKIMIDHRKIGAKNALVIPVYYDMNTGEIIHSGQRENDVDVLTGLLITDREILFKLL
jgi:hypothetical protein